MTQMPELSKGQADRLLTEMGYEDRLIGYEITASSDSPPLSLYSLQEVYEFLCGNSMDRIAEVDLDGLATWVGEVLGDSYLQHAIDESAKEETAYLKQAAKVALLLGERLEQSRCVGCP